MGAGFIGWAIDAVIASTLLMVTILLLRAKVRQVAGAQVAMRSGCFQSSASSCHRCRIGRG